MSSLSTCYMCDSIATSREHAPPRCFFPEAKALGRDLRLNLITVPSCDLHNSEKSKDDEFLRSVILMSKNNNDAGRHLFFGKLLRAAKRSPIYNSFFIDKGVISQARDRVLQIDRSRFDFCIDQMARALFFDAFMIKWQLPISIVSPNFFSNIQFDNVIPHKPTMDLVEASRIFLQNEPIRGGNPEVFKYRLRYDKVANVFALASIFYDCFEVYTFSSMALASKG